MVVIIFLNEINKESSCDIRNFLSKEYNSLNPDLQIAEFKINKKNSFLKNFLLDIYFHLPIFFISILSYLISLKSLTYGFIFFFVALLLLILIGRTIYIRRAVSKSLESNIEGVEKIIKKVDPDILIGHGWGGAVIVNLIERQIWKGNTILIAPSFYKVNKMIKNNTNEITNFRLIDMNNYEGNFVLIDGENIEKIPLKILKPSTNALTLVFPAYLILSLLNISVYLKFLL